MLFLLIVTQMVVYGRISFTETLIERLIAGDTTDLVCNSCNSTVILTVLLSFGSIRRNCRGELIAEALNSFANGLRDLQHFEVR